MWKKILSTDAKLRATVPLRIALGVIFMAHGGQKLFGWLGGKGLEGTAAFMVKLGLTPGLLWAALAGLGEFGGGLLVLVGLFTRVGSLAIAIVMLVAITKVHWGAFFMPAGIEYAATLFAVAVALLISGGGSHSLDAALLKKN